MPVTFQMRLRVLSAQAAGLEYFRQREGRSRLSRPCASGLGAALTASRLRVGSYHEFKVSELNGSLSTST